MHLTVVAGTKGEFIKIWSVLDACKRLNVGSQFIHTGQHYDTFFTDDVFHVLDIMPTVNLMAVKEPTLLPEMLLNIHEELYSYLRNMPYTDYLLVQGDTLTSMIASICAFYRGIPVVHIEAGMRTYSDEPFPEEANRKIVDACSSVFFAPTKDAIENLRKEGYPKERIFLAGGTAEDTCRYILKNKSSEIFDKLKLNSNPYCVVTIHRRETVKNFERMESIVNAIVKVRDKKFRVIFPVHPYTYSKLNEYGLLERLEGIITSPLPYDDFIHLISKALFVMSDAGGVEEECLAMGIPILILRGSSERVSGLQRMKSILLADFNELDVKLEWMGNQWLRKRMAGSLYNSSDSAGETIVMKLLELYES